MFFEVEVSDPEEKNNQLTISFLSDVDGFLFDGQPDTNGHFKILSDPLSIGPHHLSVSVEDSLGEVDSEVVVINVNSPPTISLLRMNPENPGTADDIEIQIIESADAESDDIEYLYQWYQNGNLVEGESDNSIDAQLTEKDEYWKVQVTPSDQYGAGEVVELSAFIKNAPATVDSVEITGASFTSDSTLLCTAEGSDVDGDFFVLEYVWQRMENGFLTDFESAGQEITLSPEVFHPQDILVCTASAVEGGEDEVDSASTQVTIDNRPPVIDEVLIVPSAGVRSGTEIECSAMGSDPDYDALSTSYRWFNNGQLLGIHSSLSLSTEHGIKGEFVECHATIEDSHQATVSDTASVEIQNTLPSMVTVGLNPQQPTSQDDIECVPLASDIDSDPLSYLIEWRIDNVLQSETGSVLAAPFAVGSTIECTAYADDGDGYGDQLSSSISILNTAPVINSLSLDAIPIYTNDVISLIIDSNDVDGDNIVHYIRWYVDGVLVKEGYGDNLDGAQHFDKNAQIIIEVTPNDGSIDGLIVLSSSFTVLNSPPEEPTLEILPAEVLPNADDLLCQSTALTDADGDAVSYQISWHINGALWLGNTSTNVLNDDTILAADTSDGDTWKCGIDVTDSDNVTISAESDDITISCTNNYGLAEACPATSCNEIISLYPQLYLSDGLYWLTYDRITGPEIFQAYCDMSYDGGGWTLAMKFDDSTEDLHYNDVCWDTYDLLNDTDYLPNLDVDGSTAKFEAYNGIPGNVMRLEFLSPAHNINYDSLAGLSLFELFSGGTVALVETPTGCETPASDGTYALQNTSDWNDNIMRQGIGSSFFGVNGDWTGGVGGTNQTNSMRFGYGATGANHHLWFPQIGVGIYNRTQNNTTSYTYTSVVWNEQLGCGSPCHACQGGGLGYDTTDTSANLWLR